LLPLIHVGAGEIFFRRYLPAVSFLTHEYGIRFAQVVDKLPVETMGPRLARAGLRPECYHRLQTGSAGELFGLLSRSDLASLPVIVATPTSSHVSLALAALAAQHAVGIEKPLAGSLDELAKIDAWIAAHGTDRIFLFGYYLIEKALPLLILSRSGVATEVQHRIVSGIGRDVWAELRAQLGKVKAIEAVHIEGPDTRDWTFTDTEGGHTLETCTHLLALSALWARRLEIISARLGFVSGAPYRTTESAIEVELCGDEEFPVRITCLKWAPEHLRQRWFRTEFAGGTAVMDLESEVLSIRLDQEQWSAMVVRRFRYEPQLRQFIDKLKNPARSIEYEISRSSVELALAVREKGQSQEFFHLDPSSEKAVERIRHQSNVLR
jgi:hypothetical protein